MVQLRKLLKSSVYITPELEDISTNRYKIKFLSILGISVLYTFSIVIFLLGFLYILPSDSISFLFENKVITEQAQKLEQFEKKVNILTNELNKISKNNQQLKYALFLGAADSIDSNHVFYDSLRSAEPNNLTGGNLLAIVRKIFDQDKKELEFISPATGYINRKFLPEKGHMGIDFAVAENSPVIAAADGYVSFADYTAENGHVLILTHRDKFISIYKHCSVLLKKERDVITQGETIALSGNSGYNTSGPHLHFELWKNGKVLDPEKYIININSSKK